MIVFAGGDGDRGAFSVYKFQTLGDVYQTDAGGARFSLSGGMDRIETLEHNCVIAHRYLDSNARLLLKAYPVFERIFYEDKEYEGRDVNL